MKEFLTFTNRDKKLQSSRNLWLSRPKIVNERIKDLKSVFAEYEATIQLRRDEMRIVIFTNDRSMKQRRLHIRYYFCVSKADIAKPEANSGLDFYFLKETQSNLGLYACSVWEWIVNYRTTESDTEVYEKSGRVNEEGVVDEAINRLPQIFKRYQFDPYNVDGEGMGWF
jgi:hypothetical protein